MKCDFSGSLLVDDASWAAFAAYLKLKKNPHPKKQSLLLPGLLTTLREMGARLCLEETAYIDRDFSASYSAFYSTVYQPYLKYCRRLHFFSEGAEEMFALHRPEDLQRFIGGQQQRYLGYIVIRPLNHAPVSSGLLSARHLAAVRPDHDVLVRSTYRIHLLGAELELEGVPVTEQDKRVGACAQAAIWSANRHLHNRHAVPWQSLPDITEAALRPTDSLITQSLPAGSDYLTEDNMVRAFRAIGEYPILYMRLNGEWEEPPHRIVARHLDSGIPVLIALGQPNSLGHAVTAVGSVADQERLSSITKPHPTLADSLSHFLVNDDQAGAYRRLPIDRAASNPDNFEYNLDEHCLFILIPLPNKVFIKAEVAETLARDKLALKFAKRTDHVKEALEEQASTWLPDPVFFKAKNIPERLVARTYLTHGWKYKQRMLENIVASTVKDELSIIQLPRYVWVTEFSLPAELTSLDPCLPRVCAHAVTDATGSEYEESVVLLHMPGMLMVQTFDTHHPTGEPKLVIRAMNDDNRYLPKVRGWSDYAACSVPTSAESVETSNLALPDGEKK